MSQKATLVQAGSLSCLRNLGMLIQLLALPRLYHETLAFKRSIQNGRHDVFKFTLITHIA